MEEDMLEKEVIESKRRTVYSCDQVINRLGFGFFLVYLFCHTGFLCIFHQAHFILFSLILPVLRERWGMTSLQEALIASSDFAGVFVGCILYGYLNDRIGRKKTIVLAVSVVIISDLFCAFIDDYYFFLFIRFFVGLWDGAVLIPNMLLLEFLPTKNRGLVVSLFSVMWSIGGVCASLLAWLALTNFGHRGWQYYIFFTIIPLILSLPLLYFLPESLRFLSILRKRDNDGYDDERELEIEQQRQVRIKDTIRWIEFLNRQNLFPEGDEDYEIRLINQNSAYENHSDSLISLCWNKPRFLLLFLNICFFNSASVFMLYSFSTMIPDILSNGGNATSSNIYLGVLLKEVFDFPSVLILASLVYFLSRKSAQTLSLISSSFGLFLLALPFSKTTMWYLFSATLITSIAMSVTNNAMILLTQESLPTNIRGRAHGMAFAIASFTAVGSPVVAKWIGVGHENIAMCILGFLAISAAISTLLHPKETKNASLEDIVVDNEENEKTREKMSKNGDESKVPLLVGE